MSKLTNIEKLANLYHGIPVDTAISEDVKVLVDALNSVCTEELAEVALSFPQPKSKYEVGSKHISAKALAEITGKDPAVLSEQLMECGKIGLLEMKYGEDGEVLYTLATIFPGLAEALMTLNPTPEGAYWYEYYLMHAGLGSFINTPIGRGSLRPLPVREAIKSDTKIMTFEEIEPYFQDEEWITVSDCPCRTAARTLGHGCEHTHKDICIQLGVYAQSYLISGRSRRISKAEVYDILKRAEREGLVHQVAAFDIKHGAFICNCCGCSCALLKRVNILNYSEGYRSNFVAEVNAENCVGCGACVEHCNTSALALGTCYAKEAPKLLVKPDPTETEWTEDLWNPDWDKRKMVNEQGTSPCKTFCPAHISVQGYIKKAGEGKYAEALKVIKRDNPLPAVCGRICPHNCETECTRNVIDEAIAIDDIKKFIADKELSSQFRYVPKIEDHYNNHVAVIGAGPSGLSCAYYLASYGFKVTVFEKEEKLGGMLTFGIPSFRLEKEIIDAEIDVLRELGVTFRTGVEVGKDITLDQLREKGYEAFYLAIGAQGGRKLGVEGENVEGVISGVDFLRRVNLGETEVLSGKTVVIGGGNVAIDVARTAVRVGSLETAMYCLEQKEEMPALPDEQKEAMEEGVTIHNGWGPKRMITKDGLVSGVEFKRCVSVFDEEGHFAPVYDENDTMEVLCDHVIISVGQTIVWGDLLKDSKAVITGRNTIEVNGISLQSAQEDIFAGGDVITGPKFAIDAIASGKTGAISIKRYLLGNSLTLKREREYHALDKENIDIAGFDRMPRQRVSKINNDAKMTLKDTRVGLTDEQVKKEATRCMGCGVTVVDPERCIGCGICATKCEFDAIRLIRRYDIKPAENVGEFMKEKIEYTKMRMSKIATKKQENK